MKYASIAMKVLSVGIFVLAYKLMPTRFESLESVEGILKMLTSVGLLIFAFYLLGYGKK